MSTEASLTGAARAFLDHLARGPEPGAVGQLARDLDALAVAMHAPALGLDPTTSPDPPAWPYDERRALATARFPALGLYNAVEPLAEAVGEGEPVVGADIAGELRAYLWRLEHAGPVEADWQLREGHRHHWGAHLRALQLYLLALDSAER